MTPVVKEVKAPLGLHARMAIVQGKVEALEEATAKIETKKGASYSYGFIEEGSLMSMIRPLLAEQGVAVYTSVEDVTRQGDLVSVRMSMTFVAGDERHTIYGVGDGTDYGDKALAKAQTTCTRYMLWKQFWVASKDPAGSTTESVERRPAAKPVPAKSLAEWAFDLEIDEATVNRIIRFDSKGALNDMSDIDGIAMTNHILGQLRAYREDTRAAETLLRRWEREQEKAKDDAQAVPS